MTKRTKKLLLWIAWWLFFTFLLSTYLCINLSTSLRRTKIKKTYFINIYIFSFGVISPPRPPQQRISLNEVGSTTVQVSIAQEYETRLVCFFCIHFIFLQIKVAFHEKNMHSLTVLYFCGGVKGDEKPSMLVNVAEKDLLNLGSVLTVYI